MTKVCTKCGVPKNIDEFYRRSRKNSIQFFSVEAKCKECFKLQIRLYHASHPFTPEQQQARKEAKQRHLKTQKCKKTRSAYNAAYAKRPENKQKIRAMKNRHRAYKKGATIGEIITHIDIAMRDKWVCHICQKKVTKKTWSLDHLIPLSKGGQHTRINIALAHSLCNSKRGNGYLPAQLRLLA